MTTINKSQTTSDQVFLKNQTEIVDVLLEAELITIEDIINIVDYYVDEEGQEIENYTDGDDYDDVVYHDPYMWLLVNETYIEQVKKMDLPMIEYKGSLFLGQIHGGASWEHSGYWGFFV